MNKIIDFRFVQGNGYFLAVGKEVRLFIGNVSDYITNESSEYINCCYLTHKTNKTLSGLIR